VSRQYLLQIARRASTGPEPTRQLDAYMLDNERDDALHDDILKLSYS
jgi:hypothetical protein